MTRRSDLFRLGFVVQDIRIAAGALTASAAAITGGILLVMRLDGELDGPTLAAIFGGQAGVALGDQAGGGPLLLAAARGGAQRYLRLAGWGRSASWGIRPPSPTQRGDRQQRLRQLLLLSEKKSRQSRAGPAASRAVAAREANRGEARHRPEGQSGREEILYLRLF